MPKTDDELAAIVADPEFAKFSEAERARIVRDARRAKAPLMTPQAADPVRPRARSVMERAPAPSPLAPYLTPAPRPVARTQAPPAASMLDEFRAMAPEFPGEPAADRAARDARLSRPITNPLQRAVRSAREVFPSEAEQGLSGALVADAYRNSKPAPAPLVRVPQPVAKPLASMAAQNPEPWLANLPAPATAPALRPGAPRPMPADPRLAPKTAADLPDPGAFGRWVDAHTDLAAEPSRLHPMSPGFAEGLGAGAVNMGVNAFDPAADVLGAGALGLAGKAARRLAGPPPAPGLSGLAPREVPQMAPGARPGAIFPKRIPATAVDAEVVANPFGGEPPSWYDSTTPATGDDFFEWRARSQAGQVGTVVHRLGNPSADPATGQLAQRVRLDGRIMSIPVADKAGAQVDIDQAAREMLAQSRARFDYADQKLAEDLALPQEQRPRLGDGTLPQRVREMDDRAEIARDAARGLTRGPTIDVTPIAPPKMLTEGAPRLAPGQPAPKAWYEPQARPGSIRIGRPRGPQFNAAAQQVERSLDASIRELRGQQARAQELGDGARVAELEDMIQPLDDARVTVPHRHEGPVQRIADLAQDLTEAAIRNDVPAQMRIARQIRQMQPDLYYNDRKWNLSPEETDRFRRSLGEVVAQQRSQGRDPRARVTTDEMRATAREIAPWSTEERARKGLAKGESFTAAEYEAAKQRLNQITKDSVVVERDLNDLQARQAIGQATEAEVRVKQQELGVLENDMLRLHEVITQSRSQKGRDLAFLKAQAQSGWDTGFWLARAQRASGGPLTSTNIVDLSAIVARGEAADQAGDMAARRQARIDLALTMGQLAETDPRDYLVALGKAMPLTGIATQGRNMASNTVNVAFEGAAKLPAAGIDMLLSLVTNRRTVAAPSPRSMLRAGREVLSTGGREAWEVLRYGTTLDQAAAMEVPNEINLRLQGVPGPINDLLNFAPNIVFRSMGAADKLFKAHALRRSLDDQAWLMTRNQLGRGNTPAHRAMADYLADHPTPEMQREALAHAEFMTFQNDTFVSQAIAGGKRLAVASDRKINERLQEAANVIAPGADTSLNLAPGRDAVRIFDLLIKYTKTPASIATRLADLAILPMASGAPITASGATAIGQVYTRRIRAALRNEVAEAINPVEQRAIAEGIGRGMAGTALMYLGARLYQEGLLTGSWQPDRTEEDTAAGRTPGAMLIGGQRIPLSWASPVGNLLVMGATLAREGQDAGHAAMLSWQTLLDQPLMTGAKDLVGSLKPGEEGTGPTLNRIAGGIVSAYTPNIIKEVAQATDDEGSDRLVDSSSMGSAIRTSIGKKIPSAPGVDQIANFFGIPTREQLPIKTTALGDEVDVPSGISAFSAGAGKDARDRYDQVVREVLAHPEVRLPPMPTKVPIDTGEAKVPITQAEGAELYRRQGQAARAGIATLITDPGWRDPAMTEADRTQDIQDEVNEAYREVLDEWLETHGDDLRARQAEATAAGTSATDRRRAPLPAVRQPN